MKLWTIFIAVFFMLLVIGCAGKTIADKKTAAPSKPIVKETPVKTPIAEKTPIKTVTPTATPSVKPVSTSQATINTDELDQLTDDIASSSNSIGNTPEGELSSELEG